MDIQEICVKGIIPAAGKGERLAPFTDAYPKELLPVGEKAVIHHAIETMRESGIDDICIVVGWKQHAIMDYLGSGEKFDVQLTYVVQEERDGLASAVKAAAHYIGDERFAVVLGDNYVDEKTVLQEIKEIHHDKDFQATLGAFRPKDVTSYGVIDPGKGRKVDGLIEKPSESEAPSELCISGMYVFEPVIFDAIDSIEKGKDGEYQLTDAIENLRKRGQSIGYSEIDGKRVDVGTLERLRKANQEFDPGDQE